MLTAQQGYCTDGATVSEFLSFSAPFGQPSFSSTSQGRAVKGVAPTQHLFSHEDLHCSCRYTALVSKASSGVPWWLSVSNTHGSYLLWL